MYRVLLIDDEKSIRDYLPKAVPFETYGFTVVDTASNGREALEKVVVVKPDLILLDVCMPLMDGLEFLRHLREGPCADTLVVMLSGFSDFSYAKQAMKFGVRAYLNKPVDEDELFPLLTELYQTLEERQGEVERGSLREQVKLLHRLYAGEQADRTPLAGYLLLTCVLWPSPEADESQSSQTLLYECLARCSELFAEGMFLIRGSRHSFLLPQEALQPYGSRKAFSDTLQQAFAQEHLVCSVLMDQWLFDHPEKSFREDHAAHMDEMLGHLFFMPDMHLDYHPSLFGNAVEVPQRIKALADMKRHLAVHDEASFCADACALADEIEKIRPGIQQLQELIFRIYYMLMDEMVQDTESDEDPGYLPRPEWLDLPYFFSFARWRSMLEELIREGFTFLQRTNEMASMGIGKEVVAYIHRNFRDPMSLTQVAERFYVNANYLGRVFQKATGVSFKQYVNGLRITEAKKLLLQTEKRIYEIAEEVGYTESKYFISKFTQMVGKSPTAFRSQM